MVCRYLLNPYSIVTCAGFSTITLTNLSVTAALSTKLRGGSVLSSPQNRTPLNTRKPKMVCLVIVLSPQTERKFFCTILILLHKLVCILYTRTLYEQNEPPPSTHACTGHEVLSSLCLCVAAYLSLYPAVLIFPFMIMSYRVRGCCQNAF